MVYCYSRTTSTERTSCKQRACRKVKEQVCNREKKCGGSWINWICKGWKLVCNPIAKEVCDGGCKAWNYVSKTVVNTVYAAGNCASEGMKEIAKNVRCGKYLPKCADSGICYKSKAVMGAVKCSTGVISPSERCLKENKFI